MKRILVTLCLIMGFLLASCRLDYRMRMNRFRSPEAQGKLGAGGFTVAFPAAHDLVITPDLGATQVGDPQGFSGIDRLAELSVAVGIAKRWDIYLSQAYFEAPFMLGGKYQFLGYRVIDKVMFYGGPFYSHHSLQSDLVLQR